MAITIERKNLLSQTKPRAKLKTTPSFRSCRRQNDIKPMHTSMACKRACEWKRWRHLDAVLAEVVEPCLPPAHSDPHPNMCGMHDSHTCRREMSDESVMHDSA